MSFAKLDELNRKLEAIEHAQAMLGVDEAVNMPSGGGAKRAEAMASVAGFTRFSTLKIDHAMNAFYEVRP